VSAEREQGIGGDKNTHREKLIPIKSQHFWKEQLKYAIL
jgi:hypothetical protein